MSSSTSPVVTLQDLPGLRSKTERVSDVLRQYLAGHLETLRPMSAPDRIFGKFTGGKTDAPTSDRALAEVKEKIAAFTGSPFHLSTAFEAQWLTLTGSAIEIFPWEYTHEIAGRKITMTCPLRWILNYKSGLTFAKLRAAVNGEEQARPELLRQFVVNALVLQAVWRLTPGLAPLFADLRYEVKMETPPECNGLPLLTMRSCLETFRPTDDLISAATAFSGVPAFVELIDVEASRSPRDPLKERIGKILD